MSERFDQNDLKTAGSLPRDALTNCRKIDPTAEHVNDTRRDWQEPVPYNQHDAVECPSTMPAILEAMADGICEQVQVSKPMATMAIIGAFVSALAGKISVNIGRGWKERNCAQFIIIAAESSDRKSAVFSLATEQIMRVEQSLFEEMDRRVSQQKEEKKALEERVRYLRGVYTKAPEKERKKAKERFDEAQEIYTDFTVEVIPQFIFGDITTERATSKTYQHLERIAICSAESTTISNISGRYSKDGSVNVDFYLSGHQGEPFMVDRGDRSERLKSPSVSMLLGTQPIVVKKMAKKPELREKGFIPRALTIVHKSLTGTRKTKVEEIHKDVKEMYEGLLERCTRWRFELEERLELRLSSEALSLLDDFRAELEPKLGKNGDLEHMRDWCGKLPGALVRIAGLFHAIHDLSQYETVTEEITKDEMQAALDFAEFLTYEAKQAFDLMKQSGDESDAKKLIRWLAKKKGQTLTTREIWKANNKRFSNAGQVLKALRELEHRYYVRETPSLSRSPHPNWSVSPLLQ
ncbi:MAG: YfjI family protein [Planctomycetota bacterium]|nr:YfjI family protein [Planctomycetota bacterium]